jgi:hypothetical protein
MCPLYTPRARDRGIEGFNALGVKDYLILPELFLVIGYYASLEYYL